MSWIERAKVGDRVTPIEGEGTWFEVSDSGDATGPEDGEICEISAILFSEGYVCFRFVGWNLPNDEFVAMDFKPARDTHTQVEALKRLCNPTPEVVA